MKKLLVFFVMVPLLATFLAACGGNNGGAAHPVWIRISPYSDQSPTMTAAGAVLHIFGEASSSRAELTALQCPYNERAVDATGVTVSWINLTSGQSGTADQWIHVNMEEIIPTDCGHMWLADVPVVPGLNVIETRATDEEGNAATDSVNVTFEPPSMPANLRFTKISYSEIGLAWDATDAKNVTVYKLYRNGEHFAYAGVSDATYRDSGLSPGDRYCYAVSAVGPNGYESLKSDEICASTLPLITAATGTSPWSRYRGNPRSTGVSSVDTSFTTGALMWRYYSSGSSPSIGADGTLYTGSGSGLLAIRMDGILEWTCTAAGVPAATPAIGADGTLYFGSADNKFYAVNADGTLKWSYTTDGQIFSSPAVANDGTIYFGKSAVLGPDNEFYALNPDGTLKWRYSAEDYVASSPAIGADGTIYFSAGNDKVYALNPDGTLRWKFVTGGTAGSSYPPNGLSPAVGSDGTVYLGSDKLYAIRPDGVLKWSYATQAPIVSSPAVLADGTVYIGSGEFGTSSSDGKLYAINRDGTLKWSYATGSPIESSPVVGGDGTMYFESDDCYFYALRPDGTLKWKYLTVENGFCGQSSPSIGVDGTIYAGAVGVLFAIR